MFLVHVQCTLCMYITFVLCMYCLRRTVKIFFSLILFPFLDLELKNIIDKLASFVARNGPEFEQMTKQKQKDNPKFSFLFGGEHFNYYKFKGMYVI